MKDMKHVALQGLLALLEAGADKAQVSVSFTDKHEMNVDQGELSLLRTTFDTWCGLTAIKGGRKGSTVTNKSDTASLENAAREAVNIAVSSQPDPANDISEYQPPETFTVGSESPDLTKMHFRLKELLGETSTKYPKAVLRQVVLDFGHTTGYFLNSNGVDFTTRSGAYNCMAVFSSKEGEQVSSFNYTGFSTRDLDRNLMEYGSLDTLLEQSSEQIYTNPFQGKFVGHVIITPLCSDLMLGFLLDSLGDRSVISETSLYKDKVGQAIASPLLTLRSMPVSPEISAGYFVTPDGYAAQNSTIVEKGELKGLLLGLYGSKKTGRPKAVNAGGAIVVEPGETDYREMVRSVKKGLLVTRFSGGMPSDSGDFSGVAKNSYLIQDGEIKHPVSEAMISGNLAEMLRNITSVSKERVNFGMAVLPWISVPGITISGK